MTRPFFTKDRISHFDIFNRHAEDAISQMKARFREGYALDFQVSTYHWYGMASVIHSPDVDFYQDVVSRFTLDSATEFLFGTDVCSLASGLPYPANNQPFSGLSLASHNAGSDFAAAFTESQLATSTRMRFGPAWPLFEFWSDKAALRMKSLDLVIAPIVQRALEKKKSVANEKDDESEEEETLLEHLVKATDGTYSEVVPCSIRNVTD